MRLYQLVAATLAGHGIDTLFGLMGDANMLFITDYIGNHGGRFVRCAHEASAVSMADGYARSTGRVGACSVTHGPALTNALTAITEAVRARSSVLLVTGSTPARPGHLQDFDIAGTCKLAGAGYDRVYNPATAQRDIERALHRARTEQRAVVLDVPHDLLTLEAEPATVITRRSGDAEDRSVSPDADAIDDALGLAVSAQRPVVLAGGGAVRAAARKELIALAEALGAPLATSLLGKDYFQGHPDNLGLCGGLSTAVASEVIAQSDCVLAFGASLNRFTADEGNLLGKAQRIAHCDIDASRIGFVTPVEVGLVGDARLAASMMLARLEEWPDRPKKLPDERLRRKLATAQHDPFKDRSTASTVDLRTALLHLDTMLPTERAIVTDVGRFMFAPWKYLHVPDPRNFMHTTNFASIGLGLSTAVGAAIARPRLTTVAVIGDGGFMMSMQELHAVVRNELPLIIILANDGAYGAEWETLGNCGVDPEYSLNSWPDFSAISQAIGIEAHTVHAISELDALAPRLSAPSAPLLIDLRLDPALDVRY